MTDTEVLDSIFGAEPEKRFLIQTDACDYWADDFCLHQVLDGGIGYVSVIYARPDGRCIICDIHAPVSAIIDYGTEYTLESFRSTIYADQTRMQDAAKEFIDAAKKRVRPPDGYQ
ncbi:MAG TPA: hypothetical protein PKJ51_03565 [Methanothrix sp.]|nr:hypothetical protein [Methanothrix sp.]